MQEPGVWQADQVRYTGGMSELAEENPDIDVEFGPEIAHGSGPLK